MSPRHDALLEEIASVEVIVTDSVMEALALENNLIKQRSPKYNILLRDDKNYPYLQLTTNEPFPRVLVARRVEKDGSYYAGPFLPAKLARRTMALSHKLFGIRSCNEVITGTRPPVPAWSTTSSAASRRAWRRSVRPSNTGVAVENTRLLLEGRNDELIETLRDRMADASTAERFEEAAQLRDAMRTVQILRDRQQKVATRAARRSRRLRPEGRAERRRHPGVRMRGGRVVERVELATDPGGSPAVDAECWKRRCSSSTSCACRRPRSTCRSTSRTARRSKPGSRRAPGAGEDRVPQRGDKRALVDLATRNAELSYRHGSTKITGRAFRCARERCAASSACRRSRGGSNASTSRRSRGARPWRRWSSAKTAG
jgi:excinuclease ABC subunit C